MNDADLLVRIAQTLKEEIAPAVDGEYPKTQAFMAAVVLQKLARQVALTPSHAHAANAELDALIADLNAKVAGAPPPVRDAIGALARSRDAGALSRLVEALYASRDLLGDRRFGDLLARVRHSLRGDIERRLEYEEVLRVSTDATSMQARILAYLASRFPNAADHQLHNVQRIAVGWSHETWLFDLVFRERGATQTLGLCLRRDPGNALLRHLSDLEQQFRVLQCLERTAAARAEAVLVRARSGDSRRTVPGDGKGGGRVSESVGPRRTRLLCPPQQRAAFCRRASPKRWPLCIRWIGALAGLRNSRRAGSRRRDSCGARLRSGGN